MNEREYKIRLYEIYGQLLTGKQRSYFESYYYEDLSLGEIAENCAVSRQAVQSALGKTVENLMRFESVLGLEGFQDRLEAAGDEIMEILAESPFKGRIAKLLDGVKGVKDV